MKEGPFIRWVLDVAARFDWACYHVPAPMRASARGGFVGARDAKGLCDLIMFHRDPPRLILAEVKGDGGVLTPEQREFLALARWVAEECVPVDRTRRGESDSWGGEERPEDAPVGVYVWKPGMEEQIETTLRSKVLS